MTYQPSPWQQALAQGFNDIESLCKHLQITPDSLTLPADYKNFPLRVPRGFVDCMEVGNPHDPLLRQVLPIADELREYPGYSHDPVGDLAAVAAPGVIQKYHGRVLLIMTGACAIHCRYCFRRNFPYSELQLSSQKIQQAIAYISADPTISEVILSGGDPLLLNDAKLGDLLQQLAGIEHLKRLRIHSRLPVVLPARVTPTLLTHLTAIGKQVVLVIHANHPNELSEQVGIACAGLKQHGITLLNQSVLLQGVNDDAETLVKLSEQLFALGILPYYLHLLDKASGVGHFEVVEERALEFVQHLQQTLPGYLVPKLVREQAGAAYKMPVFRW